MAAKQTTRQAIIWGRFSSSKQEDGDSRERQDRLNRACAERLGVKVIGEHFDEGVSVKDGATEKFKQVIADLPAGVGIICENLDRISRGKPWRFLTQEQLAEKSDLAPKMISLIERFQRNPSLNVADSIAHGLSVPLWRLIKDAEDLRREKIAAKKRKSAATS